MSCQGKTRSGKKCTKYLFGDNKYCELHDYFNKFSEEELACIILCSGCHKWKVDDGNKTCAYCHMRTKAHRELEKTKNDKAKCKAENCTFNACQENEYLYCGKHSLDYWYSKNIKEGINKACNGYLRGCREILDYNYGFTRCEKCREKERLKDSSRIQTRINTRQEYNKTVTKDKICTCCNKTLPLKEFRKEYSDDLYKQCAECRRKNQIRDAEEERKEKKKLYEHTDIRKQWKAKWKSENKDLVRKYYLEARDKKIEELGIDKYREKCAQQMKEWRNDRDDLINNYYSNRRLKPNEKFNYYRRTADRKSLCFWLEYTECADLFDSACYYCGMAKTDKLNIGIDRLDSCDGYTLENTVPCCEDCNLIKNTISYDIFLDKIHHVLSYNKLIDEDEYYFNFDRPCTMSTIFTTYEDYIRFSKKRKIPFDLTEKEYYNLKEQKCYICGVEPDNVVYTNGIDRLNSKIGYTMENSRTSCKECNIMKRQYTLDELYDRYLKIYNKLIKGTDRKPVSQEILNNKKNTVLCHNKDKLSRETMQIFKDYDHELKKNLQVMKTTDKKLIELRSKAKYKEADEYIKNIIMPKVVEKTQTYFKENKPENPMLTMKDDLNKLIEFDKIIKEKSILKGYTVEELYEFMDNYKKIPVADRNEEDKKKYSKYRKILTKYEKKTYDPEKQKEKIQATIDFINEFKNIPVDDRTEEDINKYHNLRKKMKRYDPELVKQLKNKEENKILDFLKHFKTIPIKERTEDDIKNYNKYRKRVSGFNEEVLDQYKKAEENEVIEQIKNYKAIPVEERTNNDIKQYNKLKIQMNKFDNPTLEKIKQDEESKMKEYLQHYKTIHVSERTSDDIRKYEKYKKALNRMKNKEPNTTDIKDESEIPKKEHKKIICKGKKKD